MSASILQEQAHNKSDVRIKISIAIAALYAAILALSWIISLFDYYKQLHWATANYSGQEIAGAFSQPGVIYGLHELHSSSQDKLASALSFFAFCAAMVMGRNTIAAAFLGGISMIGALAFLFDANQHLGAVMQMEANNPTGMFPTVAPSSLMFPFVLVSVCIGLAWPVMNKLGAFRRLEQLKPYEKKLLVPVGSLLVVAVIATFL